MYEGQNTILDLCREFGIELTPVDQSEPNSHVSSSTAVSSIRRKSVPASVSWRKPSPRVRPSRSSGYAAWVRRCRLSARAIGLLDQLIQTQPSVPLRFVEPGVCTSGPSGTY